jgi:hypothetical protein
MTSTARLMANARSIREDTHDAKRNSLGIFEQPQRKQDSATSVSPPVRFCGARTAAVSAACSGLSSISILPRRTGFARRIHLKCQPATPISAVTLPLSNCARSSLPAGPKVNSSVEAPSSSQNSRPSPLAAESSQRAAPLSTCVA